MDMSYEEETEFEDDDSETESAGFDELVSGQGSSGLWKASSAATLASFFDSGVLPQVDQ